tara:strand:- start:723 stop:2012 length:1290 start_codon:yes stop_codon:yes gene_type:complete
MNNRLEIRGVIVGPEYDDEWTQNYITKGMLTPESAFRRALAEADPAQPLTVYVNSPGGSVFAGNEMINAVRDWKLTHGQPVDVIIGAMAASMGAAFAVSVADDIKPHANAKMMFHGAWGGNVGGAESMQDYSDLLNKINADIKATLVARYDVSPETVAEWFAEGREGWLTATDMVSMGMAFEIIGEAAGEIDFAPEDILNIENRGLKIAALLSDLPTDLAPVKPTDETPDSPTAEPKGATDPGQPGDSPEAPEDTPEDAPADDSEQPDPEPEDADNADPEPETAPDDADPEAPDAPGEDTPAEDAPADDPEDTEAAADTVAEAVKLAIRADALAGVAEQVGGLQAKLKKRDDLLSKLQGAHDKALAQNAALEKSFDELQQRLSKLLAGGLSFEVSVETWDEALTACAGDYVKARHAHPEAHAAFMASRR